MSLSFFDSNVLLYLISEDRRKADIAEGLLLTGGYVSVQNLAEVTSVCRRKYGMAWEDIDALRALITRECKVHALTKAIHDEAFAIAARTGYTIYDSQVLASAAHSRCLTVWSEDMHHGHRLEAFGMTVEISNPFDSNNQSESGGKHRFNE